MYVYTLTIYCILCTVPYILQKKEKKFIICRTSLKHTKMGLCTRVYKMHIAWHMQQSQRIGYHCAVTSKLLFVIRIITIRACNYVSMKNGVQELICIYKIYFNRILHITCRTVLDIARTSFFSRSPCRYRPVMRCTTKSSLLSRP